MKKVLFIDYFFPPLAADWRGIAFAKYLPEFGWMPIVLSADESVSYDKDYSLLEEIDPKIIVHRVPHRGEPPRFVSAGLSALRLSMPFPDRYKYWIAPALEKAREILKASPVDMLYSASPTFATAYVALELKRESGIPWVADFLDGWSVNDFLLDGLQRHLLAPLRRRHIDRIIQGEKTILSEASAVAVIHPHVKARWKSDRGIDEEKITVITDGYDETLFQDLSPRALFPHSLSVIFLGTYYEQFEASIRTFLDALRRADSSVEAVFVGRRSAKVRGLRESRLTCLPPTSRKEAFELALGSSFVFVVMPPYAKWSPTKVYDYLRLGKSILALVPEDSDAAALVRKVGGTVLSYERDAMVEQLKRAIGNLSPAAPPHSETFRSNIVPYERRNITEQMARLFDRTVAGESR